MMCIIWQVICRNNNSPLLQSLDDILCNYWYLYRYHLLFIITIGFSCEFVSLAVRVKGKGDQFNKMGMVGAFIEV
jgi:hypothetical protein